MAGNLSSGAEPTDLLSAGSRLGIENLASGCQNLTYGAAPEICCLMVIRLGIGDLDSGCQNLTYGAKAVFMMRFYVKLGYLRYVLSGPKTGGDAHRVRSSVLRSSYCVRFERGGAALPCFRCILLLFARTISHVATLKRK